jgi:MSHA biogenesis protein MshM
VVLFAQPELDERLATTKFRQLKQRITFSYKLRAMTMAEVQSYIQHRMQVAGYKGASLFNKALTNKVAKVTKGIPRLVNVLCHKMLMLSYGQGQYQITNKHLSAAIKDTEATNQTNHHKWSLTIAGVLISTALIVYILKNYGVNA